MDTVRMRSRNRSCLSIAITVILTVGLCSALPSTAPAANRVYIDLIQEGGETPINVIYGGGAYEFRLWISNDIWLGGIGLAHRLAAMGILGGQPVTPKGWVWEWNPVTGGHGPTGMECVTIVPGCRMDPVGSVWDRIGFQVWDFDMDESSPDTIGVSGFGYARGCLPPGEPEHMISFHVWIHYPGPGGWYIDFDSCYVPSKAYPYEFYDIYMASFTPLFASDAPWELTYFMCGDINNDGAGPDISDLVYLVNYMFKDGPAPAVWQTADIDYSFAIDISDLVYMVNYMFKEGPVPHCPWIIR